MTYNVADLVIPIPNFVPNAAMGLAGAYHDAMANVGFGGGDAVRLVAGHAAGRGGQPRRQGQQRHDQPGRAGPDDQQPGGASGRRRPQNAPDGHRARAASAAARRPTSTA